MGNQRPQQWSQSKVGPRGRAHMGFDVTEWCNGKKAWPVVSVRNVLGSNDQKTHCRVQKREVLSSHDKNPEVHSCQYRFKDVSTKARFSSSCPSEHKMAAAVPAIYLHFEQEEGRSMVEGRGGSIFIKSTNVVPRRPPAHTYFSSWARMVVA